MKLFAVRNSKFILQDCSFAVEWLSQLNYDLHQFM